MFASGNIMYCWLLCSELAAKRYFHGAGSSDKRVNADIDIVPGKSEKQNLENPVTSSCEYKLPLVWIDLEMTGKLVEWIVWSVFCLFLFR